MGKVQLRLCPNNGKNYINDDRNFIYWRRGEMLYFRPFYFPNLYRIQTLIDQIFENNEALVVLMSRNQRQIFKTKNYERCANKVFKEKCANIKAGVIISRAVCLRGVLISFMWSAGRMRVSSLAHVLQRLHRTLGNKIYCEFSCQRLKPLLNRRSWM